jgi:hypothetical protein
MTLLAASASAYTGRPPRGSWSGSGTACSTPRTGSGGVGAGALLALFVFVEPRLQELLIDFSLFANRSYLGANAVAFAQNSGFGAVMFFLTLYLQYVLDYGVSERGRKLCRPTSS